MSKDRSHWVMDYETICNCFVAVFTHFMTNQRRVFVISNLQDDFEDYMSFLQQNIANNEYHISYNGLGFDSQITQYLLENYHEMATQHTGGDRASIIYQYAQRVIGKQDSKERLDYPPYKLKVKQIDVFKMNHWDNPAKSSSLKWIQFSMDWHNVEEMPHPHYEPVTTREQLRMVVQYCINDVESTKAIMTLSKEQINLRTTLSREYNIDLMSASEPRISKELFAYFLCKKLNIPKRQLREMRTYRPSIVLKDCILPNISFNAPEFQDLLKFFQNKVVTETKGALEYKVSYKGVDTYYGLGGIHGAANPAIYEPKPGWTIMTSDVTSFYPNLAIRNGFAPAHLPKKEFLELYEWFFEERKKIPKKDPKNYVYKIILNSTYGLSNDENSFLYDPMFTMQITINGQLLLTKLYEMLCDAIPEAIPLMQNTDGLEMMIPESHKGIYMDVCKAWENMTNLLLEHDEYSKLILADVNNYIAVYKNGNVKSKGRFEWEDQDKKKAAILHKNKSFLIIPKAINAYFISGIKPEDFIRQHTNAGDFFAGSKAKGQWKFVRQYVQDNDIKEEHLQKTIRYYVSNKGSKIIKKHKDPERPAINLVAGSWQLTEMNRWDDGVPNIKDMDIDYDFYIKGATKEIENISGSLTNQNVQLEMF